MDKFDKLIDDLIDAVRAFEGWRTTPNHKRLIEAKRNLRAEIAKLEHNQAPSSFYEALNSGDGVYRP